MGTQLPTCLISMATPTAPATYVPCKPWYDFTPFTEKEVESQGYEAPCLRWYKGEVSLSTAWHQLKFKTIVIGHEIGRGQETMTTGPSQLHFSPTHMY